MASFESNEENLKGAIKRGALEGVSSLSKYFVIGTFLLGAGVILLNDKEIKKIMDRVL